MAFSYAVCACRDNTCPGGCDDVEEPMDPELESLAALEPHVEPMTLEEYEERQEAWETQAGRLERQMAEDERAKAQAAEAWKWFSKERRVAA